MFLSFTTTWSQEWYMVSFSLFRRLKSLANCNTSKYDFNMNYPLSEFKKQLQICEIKDWITVTTLLVVGQKPLAGTISWLLSAIAPPPPHTHCCYFPAAPRRRVSACAIRTWIVAYITQPPSLLVHIIQDKHLSVTWCPWHVNIQVWYSTTHYKMATCKFLTFQPQSLCQQTRAVGGNATAVSLHTLASPSGVQEFKLASQGPNESEPHDCLKVVCVWPRFQDDKIQCLLLCWHYHNFKPQISIAHQIGL